MRRIVFFTDTDGFGGAERMLLTLLGRLDRARWEPVLAYSSASGTEPLIEGVKALEIPYWRTAPLPEGLAGASGVPDFARALRGRGVDVFHAHLTWPLACKYPLAGALLARVPAVVATVHAYPRFTMTRPTRLQQRLLGGLVSRYIAVSQDLRERLIARMPWPAERITVIHNGVEPGAEPPARDVALRDRLTQGSAQPVVLAAARLDRSKGLDVLIEAARALPGARIAIAGEGPERRALRERIEALGLQDRVVLLGWQDDLRALMAAADVVVQPSRNEGLSITVLEAMAAGRPVVASDVGGTRESVADGVTGVLVPPGRPDALAAALDALLRDPQRRAALGAAARARAVASFSAQAMAAATSAVYEELLGPG